MMAGVGADHVEIAADQNAPIRLYLDRANHVVDGQVGKPVVQAAIRIQAGHAIPNLAINCREIASHDDLAVRLHDHAQDDAVHIRIEVMIQNLGHGNDRHARQQQPQQTARDGQ